MEENQTETQIAPDEKNSIVTEESVKTVAETPVAETVVSSESGVTQSNNSIENVAENSVAEKKEAPMVESQPVQEESPVQPQQARIEPEVAPMAPIPPFVARPSIEPVAQTPQSAPNFSQNQMGEGIRKLKKIKRPVKRLPQGNPVPPSSQMINLDELLDSQMNLPTSMNAPSNNQNQSFHQENESRRVVATNNTNETEKPRFQPRFISESDFEKAPKFLDQLMVDNMFTYKGAGVIAGIVFVLTLIFGMMIFGGETVVKDGLQGVIVNAEVPRGRARCGIAERTQGCVLYIMNPQRQDLQGRDFYDLASQLTGRQRFVIETGNMRYSNVKIRAGEIAQINIPPLQ